jgi:hypothetical protein
MTIQVSKDDYHEEFFAEQRKKLRLDSKASSSGGPRILRVCIQSFKGYKKKCLKSFFMACIL